MAFHAEAGDLEHWPAGRFLLLATVHTRGGHVEDVKVTTAEGAGRRLQGWDGHFLQEFAGSRIDFKELWMK